MTILAIPNNLVKGDEGMRIVDAEFVREFIRLTDDGYRKGWHERNGGNLTYRVRPEEVDIVRSRFIPREW